MEDSLVGLLGGSFDPPHLGHINLAISLQEQYALAEVWFLPAHHSPLREKESVAPHHRLKMTELAISDIPPFRALDLELKRPPPSYTIDTLRELEKRFPQKKWALLMSGDVYMRFAEWKEAEEIRKKVKILVGCRGEKNSFTEGVTTPRMDISSTEIRKRLEKKLYCGHLLAPKVLDYIYKNRLYFSS